jgi:hypothetical protein
MVQVVLARSCLILRLTIIGILLSTSLYSKDFVAILDVNPLAFPVERLLEADEFVVRMALAKGLFKESLDGVIEPDLAKNPTFNPISGKVDFTIKGNTWSDGSIISASQIKANLQNSKGNVFKSKFLDCVQNRDKGILVSKDIISFNWKIDNDKCGNPYEVLSHQGLFIFYPNSCKTLKEYLHKYPLSSGFKFIKNTEENIFLKSIKYSYNLIFSFIGKKNTSGGVVIYRRVRSLKENSNSIVSAGYGLTISFESLGLKKEDINSLTCLGNAIYQNMKVQSAYIVKASSYSLSTSQALKIFQNKNQENLHKCTTIDIPITISKKFSEDFPVILDTIKKRKFRFNIIEDKKWRQRWTVEKWPLTVRLQKVRTNNIHALFFSYFQSGVSAYSRITKLIDEIHDEGKSSYIAKNMYIKKSLHAIHFKGYIVPIIHAPIRIETSPKCSKVNKIDIYFNFEDFLTNCGEF